MRRISSLYTLNMATIFHLCAVQFLAVLCLLGEVEAACPPTNPGDGSVIDYQPINETQYEMTYSEIGSEHHPLGFYSATWYYNQQDQQNPCIKISAPQASLRWIDVKVETIPSSRLCFKDQSQDSPICFQGRGTVCRATPGNDIYIEFLCDNQCEEADVNFWYRLVLSPPPSVQDPETWCSERPVHYPTDLLKPPPGQTLPPGNTTPRPKGDTGAASRQTTSLLILATMMLWPAFCL